MLVVASYSPVVASGLPNSAWLFGVERSPDSVYALTFGAKRDGVAALARCEAPTRTVSGEQVGVLRAVPLRVGPAGAGRIDHRTGWHFLDESRTMPVAQRRMAAAFTRLLNAVRNLLDPREGESAVRELLLEGVGGDVERESAAEEELSALQQRMAREEDRRSVARRGFRRRYEMASGLGGSRGAGREELTLDPPESGIFHTLYVGGCLLAEFFGTTWPSRRGCAGVCRRGKSGVDEQTSGL